jgi:sugar lactone lactonase YvrE
MAYSLRALLAAASAASSLAQCNVTTFYRGPICTYPGGSYNLIRPMGVAVAADGSLLVTDAQQPVVATISRQGSLSVLAGRCGTSSYDNDGVGTNALLYSLGGGISAAPGGAGVFVEWAGGTARHISRNATVTTLAGRNGDLGGYADGQGSNAKFYWPWAVAVDVNGTAFVADSYNCMIRSVSPSGLVQTAAGAALQHGYIDGPAMSARFNNPKGIAVDANGRVFIADTFNSAVRVLDLSRRLVSTLAGTVDEYGFPKSGYIDGDSSVAAFDFPYGVAVDAAGFAIVVDTNNNAIRKVSPTGYVVTLAGRGVYGTADGVSSAATFQAPVAASIDAAGTVYIADGGAIRALSGACPAAPGAPPSPAATPSAAVVAGASVAAVAAIAGAGAFAFFRRQRAARAAAAASGEYRAIPV